MEIQRMSKAKLIMEPTTAREKLERLQNWLYNHTTHPDFMMIANDRNHLTVKIEAMEFKIGQLEKGLPILGESMFSPETANSQSQLTNGFRSIHN